VDVDAITSVLGTHGLEKGRCEWVEVIVGMVSDIVRRLDYSGRANPNAPGNLIVLTGDAHAHRRRLWNRGMSAEALYEYESMIQHRLDQMIEEMPKRPNPVDLSKWITYFSFDFMGDMA
jgi:cytochrome P450